MVRGFSWHTLLAQAALCAGLAVSPVVAWAADTAEQMMANGHNGRASWQSFPGFQADVVAKRDNQVAKGALSVAKTGEVTIEWRKPKEGELPDTEWVKRSLQSIINHRLDGGAAITNVEFADEDTSNPLGRLIRSKEPAEKSLWRVQGDVLTEVQRITEKTRMIISVAEVSRTPEGKHLPRSFVTTTWNKETGALQSARQVFQEWKRINGVDLPVRLTAMINSGDNQRHIEEIALTNLVLTPPQSKQQVSLSELPALTIPVTSLGAGVADGYLYVFGGHTGSAHKYNAERQAHQMWRLNLKAPKAWELVGETPRRTGTAMVSYKNQLYRIGGWEAKNKDVDKWELHSSSDFARFNPQTKQWEDLSPLPEGRSSHDAALLGSKLYVVGGWKLSGDSDGDWHSTAYVCDLDDQQPQWKAIAKPPFLRRALSVAGYNGKVYVIGGMDDNAETHLAVSVYDPASDRWSQGADLPGKGMDGFGTSSFGTEKGLFATTSPGFLYRLADEGKEWEVVTKIKHPRFFHRLVQDGSQLLIVGGTSFKGKVAETEAIELK